MSIKPPNYSLELSNGLSPLTTEEITLCRQKMQPAFTASRLALIIGIALAGIALIALGSLGGFHVMALSEGAIQALISGGFLINVGLAIGLCIAYKRLLMTLECLQWNMGSGESEHATCRLGYYVEDSKGNPTGPGEWSQPTTEKQREINQTAQKRGREGEKESTRLPVLQSNLREIVSQRYSIITLQETRLNLPQWSRSKDFDFPKYFTDNQYAYVTSNYQDVLVAWDTTRYGLIGGKRLKGTRTRYAEEIISVDLLEKESGRIIRVFSGWRTGHNVLSPSTTDRSESMDGSNAINTDSSSPVYSGTTLIAAAPDLCVIGMDANAPRNSAIGVIEYAEQQAGFVTDNNDNEPTCLNPQLGVTQLDWIHAKGKRGDPVTVLPSKSLIEQKIPLFDPEKNASDHRPVAKEIRHLPLF